MSELFKLVRKNFSEIDNEWRWTYSCLLPFTFKKYTITEITITDHFQQKKGRKKITLALILTLFQTRINGRKRMKPRKSHGLRDVYVREKVPYDDKKYRLIFWFKDGTTNHLWIRNCYPID